MRRPNIAVGVLTLAALLLAIVVGPSGAQDAHARYEALEDLPTTAGDVSELERVAIELAGDLDAVLVADPVRTCERDRLRVTWEEPEGYERGTLIEPIGPPPGPQTQQVNGAVVCDGSRYQFMGFEAYRDGDVWRLAAAPVFDEQLEASGAPPDDPDGDLDPATLADLRQDLDVSDLGPVDPYAPYQPQRLCDPRPKPGAVALARLLLDTYAATANWGIARDCDIGGVSEHKEGRAFDWGASVDDPHQRVAVEHMLLRMLSTDGQGNAHALARRMGVMYLIWDGRIWSSFRADEGWRPYGGPSAHRDHVHLSLSWEGAMGETSLWRAADLGPFVWDLMAPAADGVLPGPSALVAPGPHERPIPDIGAGYDRPGDDPSPSDDPSGTERGPSDDPSGEDGSEEPLPTELPSLSTETPLPTESPTLEPSELLNPSLTPLPSPSLSETLDDTTDELLQIQP